LVTPGREFLVETDSLELEIDSKKNECHVFLFNDMLLFARAKGKKYTYIDHIGKSCCLELDY